MNQNIILVKYLLVNYYSIDAKHFLMQNELNYSMDVVRLNITIELDKKHNHLSKLIYLFLKIFFSKKLYINIFSIKLVKCRI